MKESQMLKIVSELKKIILKPIYFGGITIELVDVKRSKHGAGHVIGGHHHPWFEFNYYISDGFHTFVDDKTFILKKGDFLLMPPGTTHSHTSPTGDDGICIRWQILKTDEKIKDGEAAAFYESVKNAEAKVFSGDMNIFKHLGGSVIKNQAVFLSWLISVYADAFGTEAFQKIEEYEKNFGRVSNQVILYLKECYKNNVTTADVANALNMSYRNLSRLFRQETGITIIEQLNEIRISKARKLLLTTDMPVSKIAEETGFLNVYYFSTAFKKYAFMSPKQFRESNRI